MPSAACLRRPLICVGGRCLPRTAPRLVPAHAVPGSSRVQRRSRADTTAHKMCRSVTLLSTALQRSPLQRASRARTTAAAQLALRIRSRLLLALDGRKLAPARQQHAAQLPQLRGVQLQHVPAIAIREAAGRQDRKLRRYAAIAILRDASGAGKCQQDRNGASAHEVPSCVRDAPWRRSAGRQARPQPQRRLRRR